VITKNKINKLKLIGKNEKDLKVMSAYLQDSIILVKNMVFLKKNRIFVIILNRYMWEDVEKGVFRKNKRIKCAVKFEDVINVKSQNINQKNKNKILEFLAVKCIKNLNEIYEIKIFFSGGSMISVFAETINIFLDDFGKPWNVKHAPMHKI
tara:strand:+ start:4548 stop:5000 length:453 start_codon:yes stop_codon:yes gene_type:complete